MRYTLVFLLILVATCFFALDRPMQDRPMQDRPIQKPAPDTVFLNGYGTFEGYLITLDGNKIERETLASHPGLTLHRWQSSYQQRDTYWYPGALHFATKRPAMPPSDRASAYFINGRQVSRLDIEKSNPELYTHIEKSEQDTVVGGVRYGGYVRVETTEDFFCSRIPVFEYLRSHHPDFPLSHTFVMLNDSRFGNAGFIYDDDYLHYVNPQHVVAVKAGSIELAEGMRKAIHLVDTSWRYTKMWHIFEDPAAFNPVYPCYVAEDTYLGDQAFVHPELPSYPFHGKDRYLKRLSETLALPGSAAGAQSSTHSIDLEFLVSRAGMLTHLKATSPARPADERILHAIKRRSCDWSVPIMGGRPVWFIRKMTIHYTTDKQGNLLSLDNIAYRYDY